MVKCFVDFNHPLYGYNRQNKDTNIIVSVTEDIRPCVKWNTKNFDKITKGTYVNFDRRAVPLDRMNCNADKCVNTGTLFFNVVDADETRSGKVRYRLRTDARKYMLGFNAIYINTSVKGNYIFKMTISDYNDPEQENAYVYTRRFNAPSPGDYLQVFDLLDSTIITQIGDGWRASDRGATVTYEVQHDIDIETHPLTNARVGLSTGIFINERAEMRKFANVLLSCITSFTHNISTPATDARCFGAKYNPEEIEITKEITATTTSCNDYWLNPLQSVSKQFTSGIPSTVHLEVKGVRTQTGKEYGMIHLPDLYLGDCNSLVISDDDCDCTYLTKLPVTIGNNLEDDEYILIEHDNIREVATNLDPNRDSDTVIIEAGTVLMHPVYIGKKLLITYNAEREVELIVANDKRLHDTRFRVIQEVEDSRGRKHYLVFNHVLITENSREYGTDGEITLSLTFTVNRDKNGNFYEIRRNTNDLSGNIEK